VCFGAGPQGTQKHSLQKKTVLHPPNCSAARLSFGSASQRHSLCSWLHLRPCSPRIWLPCPINQQQRTMQGLCSRITTPQGALLSNSTTPRPCTCIRQQQRQLWPTQQQQQHARAGFQPQAFSGGMGDLGGCTLNVLVCMTVQILQQGALPAPLASACSSSARTPRVDLSPLQPLTILPPYKHLHNMYQRRWRGSASLGVCSTHQPARPQGAPAAPAPQPPGAAHSSSGRTDGRAADQRLAGT
jgi:hypothetical protein